ncbi:hypothetical protein RCH06_003419, partial [Polaromonas sp. CG_9.5]|nr:hypothetical protein [Polaromonas sp. CG_9.5]
MGTLLPQLPLKVTLPPENVSLAEWFNSDKENENDKDIKGQV